MESVQDLISGDDERAEAAVARIAACPKRDNQALLGELGQLLTGEDEDLRWWATRALSEIDHPDVPILLIKMLADEASSVRACAALGLRHNPTSVAIPHLVAALAERDRLFAGLAADALEAIGEAAVMALIDVLTHGPQVARLPAVRALARIGDTRAIPALFAALDDDSALIGHWASRGLEDMGIGMIFFEP